MLELIPRSLEYLQGYKEYSRELYEAEVIFFRPVPPDYIDEGWFIRTKPVYDAKERGELPGQSKAFHYWAVDGGKFIGELQIRTEFTEKVLNDIGSIGYAVRPSEWGKGYGTELIRLGLAKAKELGMERLLFTVNEENPRSAHVIEKCGGVLTDTIDAYNDAEGLHRLRRYWIELS